MVMYNISLSDISNLTDVTLDKVKLVAYFLYSALITYEDDSRKTILYKDDVESNEIFDKYVDGFSRYEFEHTDYYTGKYEPFMISNTSFGFTVYADSIDNQELRMLIEEAKSAVSFSGEFNINSIPLKNKHERMAMFDALYPKNVNAKPKSMARRLRLAGIVL